MPQGPTLIFDKSTIQTLTLDQAVLLDNFYVSNVVPIFFAECLADLEKTDMGKLTCSPESLVRSLAEKTPDQQVSANVFHLLILEGELAGKFDLRQVHYRPLRNSGRPVMVGDSKGLQYQSSEEEDALQRWANRDYLGLERDIAKKWRSMVEGIDLSTMSSTVVQLLGIAHLPATLEECRSLTDKIIDSFDQQLLLRFGLATLAFTSEAVRWILNRWQTDGQRNIRDYLPYFTHVLSINIFFAVALQGKLLKKVKPSHQIDLAYLYYLPFCTVFTSRDNFHVQVAPLFMDSFQTFVHGDDLRKDLARLDEMYKALPNEEQEKGLIGFAATPPEDCSFLTTRLWDKYLPKWREPHPKPEALSPQILEALDQMHKRFTGAAPTGAHNERDVSKLDFVTMSKKVSLGKGSYLRYSKDTIRKIMEGERQKELEDAEEKEVKVWPAGTRFTGIIEELVRVLADSKTSRVEVFFLTNKRDSQGAKIIVDGMEAAQIHFFGVSELNGSTHDFLRDKYYELSPRGSLILWTRYGEGKLGRARFLPTQNGQIPDNEGVEQWEWQAMSSYMERHKL